MLAFLNACFKTQKGTSYDVPFWVLKYKYTFNEFLTAPLQTPVSHQVE